MTKVAILIDGGYFLKRLPSVRDDIDVSDPHEVVRAIDQLIHGHLSQLNEIYHAPNMFGLLYRCFYYDAFPYGNKGHTLISKRSVDFSKSNVAILRNQIFDVLRGRSNFALRLGEVRKASDSSWVMKPQTQKRLLRGDINATELTDKDFVADLYQKGVDMRIGIDIASITMKHQADIIVLISGDSDFVPAAKLARREGATFILDPLWHSISHDLLEHIDRLASGFPNPSGQAMRGF